MGLKKDKFRVHLEWEGLGEGRGTSVWGVGERPLPGTHTTLRRPMPSGLPSGTHCAHLQRKKFIVRQVGGARGGVHRAVGAVHGTRTDSPETSIGPSSLLEQSPSSLSVIYSTYLVSSYYVPGLMLVVRTPVHPQSDAH